MNRKFSLAVPLALLFISTASLAPVQAAGSTVTLYAVSAVGSSNYDVDPNDYGPGKATGAPDTEGGCNDVAGSWATLVGNEVATITLTYERALIPNQIRIWANLNPKAVTKVETLSGSTWTTVFDRNVEDADVLGADCSTTPRTPLTVNSAAVTASGNAWSGKPVTQVRVTVDQSTLLGWAGEIDAVELSGVAGVAAKATSNATLSGTAKVGQKLTVTKGKYTGTPAPSVTYQWYACSKNIAAVKTSVDSSCAKISGATASTFTLTSAQVGKFISAAVIASNGVGSSITGFTKSTGKVSKK